MNKIYFLDTCIILKDPNLDAYKGKTCYIPIAVMEELDRQKSLDGEVGFKSRLFHRKLRGVNKENFIKEKSYDFNGVTIINPTIELEEIEPSADIKIADDFLVNSKFLKTDLAIAHTHDFSCFNRMRLHGCNAEYVDPKKSLTEDMTNSYKEIYVDPEIICNLNLFDSFQDFGCMDYLLLINNTNPNHKRLVKIRDKKLEDVKKTSAYGLTPRNIEQIILLDSLLDDRVKAIILSSVQGGGKTLLSLAGALEQTVNTRKYGRVLLGKSQASLSKSEEVGFLPGTLSDKLQYSMTSYFSNLETLSNGGFSFNKDGKIIKFDGEKIFQQLQSIGYVDYLPLDSILGASFDNTFILIDEAQSLDFKTIRSALTRIKDTSKIVLLGDVRQETESMRSIDSSGLYIANKYLRNIQGIQVVTLSKIERGEACRNIAEALDKIDF